MGKNQNAESSHLVGRNDQERLKQKQSFQREIQTLKNEVQKSNTNKISETMRTPDWLSPHKRVQEKLTQLEKMTNALNHRDALTFSLASKNIEAQLENIRKTREELSSFQRKIVKVDPSHLQSAVQKKLRGHAPKANQGRAKSIKKILDIQPQDWGNPVANRAARRIQKLVN